MNRSDSRRGEGRYLLVSLRCVLLLGRDTDCLEWDFNRVLGIVLAGWQADVDLDRHDEVGDRNDACIDDGGAVQYLLEDEMIAKGRREERKKGGREVNVLSHRIGVE